MACVYGSEEKKPRDQMEDGEPSILSKSITSDNLFNGQCDGM